MIILENNKPSKFVYDEWYAKYGLQPNATPSEVRYWWEREEEYWNDGRFGLTGAHYFALTQGKVKTAEGLRVRPVWRDIDEQIYGSYYEAQRTNHDLFVTKRREIGLSFIFGGVMPVFTSLRYPGSTSLITSADKPRLKELYKDKLRVMFDSIDPTYRPSVVSTRQEGYLHLGKLNKQTGEVTGLDSKIVTQETVVDPAALEAYRAMFCFIDEALLHPKASSVLKSAQASVKKGFRKMAPIVLGGSASLVSPEGSKLASELWRDSEFLKILTLFIPGTMGIMEAPELDKEGKETGKYLNFCPNGHSDVKAAEEWILRTREMLGQAEDKSYLESFIKQYPLELSEVITVGARGNLPKDVENKVLAREKILLGSSLPIERCTLSKDIDDAIKIHPDPKGRVRILERPIEGHTYIAGNDPIPYNSSNVGDGSSQVLVIKDLTLNRYVAWMKDRDSDPDDIIKEQILLQDLYFGAKNMLEINRGGVTKEKYKQYGRMDLLAGKPTLLGKGYTQGDGSVGFYKTNDGWITTQLNFYLLEYFRKFIDEIYFLEFIEEAKGFLAENTDLLDAIAACELYTAWFAKKQERANSNNGKIVEFKTIKRLVPGPGGRMIVRWDKVPTVKND